MTQDQVTERLRAAVAQHPSQVAFCRAHGVSPTQLSETLYGRRPPSPAVLRALGLRKVVLYAEERQAAKEAA